MKRSEFNVGDRLLIRVWPSDTIFECVVVEVAKTAVKIRYASCSEQWEPMDDVEGKWELLEKLCPITKVVIEDVSLTKEESQKIINGIDVEEEAE